MKFLRLALIIALSLVMTACGNKDGGGNNSGTYNPLTGTAQTVESLIHVQQPIAEIGGKQYQIPQQSFQAITMAVQQAQSQNIQPIVHNGVQKYKARITIMPSGYGQGYNQMPNQYGAQTVVNISSAIIHR